MYVCSEIFDEHWVFNFFPQKRVQQRVKVQLHVDFTRIDDHRDAHFT